MFYTVLILKGYAMCGLSDISDCDKAQEILAQPEETLKQIVASNETGKQTNSNQKEFKN